MTERMRVPKDEEPRMTRYYAEEPCEECGRFHADHLIRNNGCYGSGGSRRRVRIDHLQALHVLTVGLTEWAKRTNQRAPFFKTRADIARLVVDAALVTEEGT